MASTALCNCGRALDWRTLINSNQLYSASLSCETCNTSLSINNSFSNNNSNNNNNASSPPTSPKNYNVTVRSPSFKGKGKGKEREGGNEGLTGDRSTYARLQMLRLKNKFVYNPYQGYELEVLTCYFYFYLFTFFCILFFVKRIHTFFLHFLHISFITILLHSYFTFYFTFPTFSYFLFFIAIKKKIDFFFLSLFSNIN